MQSSDLEIAQSTQPRPIRDIALGIGLPVESLIPYGHYKAKLSFDFIARLPSKPTGKTILVTAMSPTPAGEGKTTMTIGLGDALSKLNQKTMICLREPSLGPCFGKKGGAAGGGFSQVIPMDEINLHFTGDFHAVTAAHNLLAALIDNHIFWGNNLEIEKVVWRRSLDLNDRALRKVSTSPDGDWKAAPSETGFDISVASEIMAILCLSRGYEDLTDRLGKIVVGWNTKHQPVFACDLKAEGAMAVLLKDALQPNLVQTLEATPALVHGGPFANIAHGCSSLIATETALRLADLVVTEAGFGADLGAEKFFDIKCRMSDVKPSAVVLVVTVRSLKYHGGLALSDLKIENLAALEKGFANLRRHVENLRKFGFSPIIALNKFDYDTDREIEMLRREASSLRTEFSLCTNWKDGGKGALDLAQKVMQACQNFAGDFRFLYEGDLSLLDKIHKIATEIYRADGVRLSEVAAAHLSELERLGFGNLPICIAKTQYSFSADPKKIGAAQNFEIEVRDLVLAAGAGFVVAICGDIMRMPGLPKHPAAELMSLDPKGRVVGLS